MNLTDSDDNEAMPEQRSRQAMNVVRANRVAQKAVKRGTVDSSQLSGFFSSVVNSIKRTHLFPVELTKGLVTGGPKGAFEAMKAEGNAFASQDLRQVAAPVLTAVSTVIPILRPVAAAAGAAGKYVQAKDLNAKAIDEQKAAIASSISASKGSDQALIAAYKQIAGSAPGRQIGESALRDIFQAAYNTGFLSSPLGVWPGMIADIFDSRGGRAASNPKHTAAPGFNELVEGYLSKGLGDPAKMAADYFSVVGAAPPDDQFARQLYIDAFDALAAKRDANFPFTYGIGAPDVPAPTPTPTTTPAPVPVIAPGPSPVVSQPAPTNTGVVPPAPVATAVQQTGIDPSTAAMIQSLMSQMQSQNANAAQIQAAALQALAARGVDTSRPAVVQAVAADAAKPQTAGGGASLWIAGGLALAATLFALARPSRGKH